MAFDARRLYYYLVCLITLVMVIIGGVQVVNHVLDLVMPPDPYRPTRLELAERASNRPQSEYAPSPEQLEEQAQQEVERQRRDQRRGAIRGLIGSLALIFIAGPVYLYHWRKVRTDQETG